jgi:hypothetical protein
MMWRHIQRLKALPEPTVAVWRTKNDIATRFNKLNKFSDKVGGMRDMLKHLKGASRAVSLTCGYELRHSAR